VGWMAPATDLRSCSLPFAAAARGALSIAGTALSKQDAARFAARDDDRSACARDLLLDRLLELLLHLVLRRSIRLELRRRQHGLQRRVLLRLQRLHLAHLHERPVRALDDRIGLLRVLEVD